MTDKIRKFPTASFNVQQADMIDLANEIGRLEAKVGQLEWDLKREKRNHKATSLALQLLKCENSGGEPAYSRETSHMGVTPGLLRRPPEGSTASASHLFSLRRVSDQMAKVLLGLCLIAVGWFMAGLAMLWLVGGFS